MIQSWRDAWDEGEFPFYWVQLADFMEEKDEPGDSAWAELREAQTMTLELPNTGQAVIIDLGESDDIHPRNKEDVGERLARWALAQDYGIDIAHRSPELESAERQGSKMLLTFAPTEGGLMSFDDREVQGFAIAGEDREFVNATAKIVTQTEDGEDIPQQAQNQVLVWSEEVDQPVAVRYGWADNPVCNLQTTLGLPVTPFRTDDWPGVTMGK
jgi:sialate O-acetylesterase